MGDGVVPGENASAHVFDNGATTGGFAVVAGIVHGEAFSVGR